ncbi:MAG: Ni/Fe-hydrogenase cytochrome b subunit [Gammaproteobacteria bacterium]|nr:Ni/Fe-hydrogenase cytochrome b subunit [Gammaproteobacteria bacterium]
MSAYRPLGGRILTPTVIGLAALAALGFFFLAIRFISGMGAVTNLNGGYAWGIWVVYDVVVGTAFACGGYALAIAVYVLNKGQYHPLVRPALLASLLGYALGGFGAFFDMGRWWQFYNILLPWHWNFNSVMLEVGLCVMAYIVVLAIEFSPAFLERLGLRDIQRKLNKLLFLFIAIGVLLPTMHQSSLGSLLIAMGHKVHPLWQAMELMPLLAIVTAVTMGFSIVLFEGSMVTAGFKRPSETHLLSGLSRAITGLIVVYLVIRFGELLVRGKLGLVFAFDFAALMFWIETALFLVPLVVLSSPAKRDSGRALLIAAVSMLFAGALWRFNAYLITFNPGPGYSYFPSVPEIMVTVGIVAFEVLVYIVLVRLLPVLHDTRHA